MVAISFDVPAQQEPTDIIREFAFGLKARYGGRAGEHWVEHPDPSEGIRRIRVQLPKDPDASIQALWALVGVNLWCLRHLRQFRRAWKPLYESACYKREPEGSEVWQSNAALYQRGLGDCEDLVCARVAERLLIGDSCRPGLKRQVRPNGSILYHVIIGNPDGTIEDPSAELGMTFGAQNVPDSTSSRCRTRLGVDEP